MLRVCLYLYVSCVSEKSEPIKRCHGSRNPTEVPLAGQRTGLGLAPSHQRSDTGSSGGRDWRATDGLKLKEEEKDQDQELAFPSPLGLVVAPDRLSSCILGAPAAGRHEKWPQSGPKTHPPARTEGITVLRDG